MVYTWKVGSHLKADAKKVGKEVEKIKGNKTPEKLLDFARGHPKSELHSCFEWNNSKAAEKYRLDQARHILGCLVITKVEYCPTEKKEVKISQFKAYENVKTETGRAYVSTPVALETPEYQEQIFNRIRRGINDLESLADTYSEMLKNPKKFKASLQGALEFV